MCHACRYLYESGVFVPNDEENAAADVAHYELPGAYMHVTSSCLCHIIISMSHHHSYNHVADCELPGTYKHVTSSCLSHIITSILHHHVYITSSYLYHIISPVPAASSSLRPMSCTSVINRCGLLPLVPPITLISASERERQREREK